MNGLQQPWPKRICKTLSEYSGMTHFVGGVPANIKLYQLVWCIWKELFHEGCRFVIGDIIVADVNGSNWNREVVETACFQSVFEEIHVISFAHAP